MKIAMTIKSRFLLNFAGLGLVASLLGAPGVASAGFLFESTPPAPQPVKAQADAPRKSDAAPAIAGRNVDQSAKVDRLARMNRQRIDLESKLTSRITQSGDSPAELPAIKGMGRNVSLEDALRQILPTGWGAYSDQDLPLTDLVNWSGNRTWPMVLHGLLAERDMRAHIDWKNQEVMFFAPAPKDEVTQPILASPTKGVEVRIAEAPKAIPATQPAAVVTADAGKLAEGKKEVVWVLSPEHTLRENLRRWAGAVGWNLVWNAVSGDSVIDYPVDAKVEFSGEVLGGNGAMAKVIIAYSDADFPLEIEFFRGNRVVEVRLHQVPDVKSANATAQASAPPRSPLAAIGEAPALNKTQAAR